MKPDALSQMFPDESAPVPSDTILAEELPNDQTQSSGSNDVSVQNVSSCS